MDPAQVGDIYSRTLTAHVFEALFAWDPLARPVRIRPLTAAALPEPSADFRAWTIRLQPGIQFTPDPAFRGTPRELVAQDYVYMLQRHADPANRSPSWPLVDASFGIVGLAERRAQALRPGGRFDYDAAIEGLRAPDRHTLRLTLREPRPRLLEMLAASDVFGAVAREVVEHYGEQIGAHPVGTGPFCLRLWQRSARIVFERNPDYRERRYDALPAADDAEGQALLARLRGRRLPMVDRVEITVAAEEQPRWLAFAGAEADFIERVPPAYAAPALPAGRLAPQLARRGVQACVQAEPGATMLIFNMDHELVGGYAPAQVALRRALALAMDTPREIALILQGRALPAQSPIAPYCSGYDAHFSSEMSRHDPARAQALLDLYGYLDRDGDGWRERPDGRPLVVELAAQPDQISRPYYEMLDRNLKAVGVRLQLKFADWSENRKAAREGRFMVWTLSDSAAAVPDGQAALARYASREIGGQNLARFSLPAFDAVYERLLALPDGPERQALFLQAKRLAVAYMPYKLRTHRILTDMAQPWLQGYRRPVFGLDWWQWVDVDPALREAAARPV
jgi:ABC-type transport system substrate-binding protein